jgi:hypothetical protein
MAPGECHGRAKRAAACFGYTTLRIAGTTVCESRGVVSCCVCCSHVSCSCSFRFLLTSQWCASKMRNGRCLGANCARCVCITDSGLSVVLAHYAKCARTDLGTGLPRADHGVHDRIEQGSPCRRAVRQRPQRGVASGQVGAPHGAVLPRPLGTTGILTDHYPAQAGPKARLHCPLWRRCSHPPQAGPKARLHCHALPSDPSAPHLPDEPKHLDRCRGHGMCGGARCGAPALHGWGVERSRLRPAGGPLYCLDARWRPESLDPARAGLWRSLLVSSPRRFAAMPGGDRGCHRPCPQGRRPGAIEPAGRVRFDAGPSAGHGRIQCRALLQASRADRAGVTDALPPCPLWGAGRRGPFYAAAILRSRQRRVGRRHTQRTGSRLLLSLRRWSGWAEPGLRGLGSRRLLGAS